MASSRSRPSTGLLDGPLAPYSLRGLSEPCQRDLALSASLSDLLGSVWYYCLVMARITFSLDDATVAQIRQTAARLQRPQSHVVRDAVADYAARTDRLSERERQHLMGVLERLRGAKPTRPATGVDAELRAIRTARRVGGRRHSRA